MTEALHRLVLLAGTTALAVAAGAALYLVVSFVVLMRHAEARSIRRTLRAFFHEALAVAVTQPLVPLFYLVGRRMGGSERGVPVIFVHGYFQNRADFVYLAWVLGRAGKGPLFAVNYDFRLSVGACATAVAAFVEGVCRQTGRERVAIVAHSLGGIVALEYLGTDDGTRRVERCVTVASPHAGVLWRVGVVGRSARELRAGSAYMQSLPARRLPIEVLSIYSSHDNIVHPATTSALAARGGIDQEIPVLGHLGMLFSREVADAVIAALP